MEVKAVYDQYLVLGLVKQRLNRLPSDTTLDDYLATIINAAAGRLMGKGIRLNGSDQDTMLLVNVAVQMYQSRDQQAGDPDWLKKQILERWLTERRCPCDT